MEGKESTTRKTIQQTEKKGKLKENNAFLCCLNHKLLLAQFFITNIFSVFLCYVCSIL